MYPAVWSSSTNVQIFGVPTLVVTSIPTINPCSEALALTTIVPTAVVALSPGTGIVLNVAVVITPTPPVAA